MRPRRAAMLRKALVATLLCGVALLCHEASRMFAQQRHGSNALHAAIAGGETDSSQLSPAYDPMLEAELMTPELVQQIESQESDCLRPMHVHLIWIGDIDKAPPQRHQYTEMGYNLTVHTSAEEILAGFQPFVLRALKLAVPKVVGYDFLKFALLYKYGGLAADADTTPSIHASALRFPSDCDIVFGKEARLAHWEKPIYRESGANTYGLNRPFQILNWAMAASKPRNVHIKRLIEMSMMHLFGLRDTEFDYVQDVAGSGLMTDYVALLHEREGRNYQEVYRDETKYVPIHGLCLTDGYLHGGWIRHAFFGSWKAQETDVASGDDGSTSAAVGAARADEAREAVEETGDKAG